MVNGFTVCNNLTKILYSTGRVESHGYLNETDRCPYSVFHETVAASCLLSLSPTPLSLLSPTPSLLALLSFPKCFYQSIFTEVFSQPSLYSSFSRNITSPKQSHRNQITEIWMSIFIRKKFAGCWSWTRVSSVHKRVCYPLGYVVSTKYEGKNVLFVQKREQERERERKREIEKDRKRDRKIEREKERERGER